MIRSCFLLTALLWCGTLQAQVTAVIAGPKEAEAGDLIILDASGSSGASAFEWALLNSNKQYMVFDSGKRLVFASGQAAEYQFAVIVAGASEGGALKIAITKHTVRIGTPVNPTPVPTPTPTPTPEPTPTVGQKTILIWYETAQASVPFKTSLTKLRTDAAMKARLKNGKHWLLILDDDPQWVMDENPTNAMAAAIAKAKTTGAPCVVVVDSSDTSKAVAVKCDEWTLAQFVEFFDKQGVR